MQTVIQYGNYQDDNFDESDNAESLRDETSESGQSNDQGYEITSTNTITYWKVLTNLHKHSASDIWTTIVRTGELDFFELPIKLNWYQRIQISPQSTK